MSDRQRSCATCRFCVKRDHGYSNWTVMSTAFYCLLGLNPALDGEEEPYHELTPALTAALDVALTCPRYRDGAPVHLDVDMESVAKGHTWGTPYTVEDLVAYAEDDEAEALRDWLNRGDA